MERVGSLFAIDGEALDVFGDDALGPGVEGLAECVVDGVFLSDSDCGDACYAFFIPLFCLFLHEALDSVEDADGGEDGWRGERSSHVGEQVPSYFSRGHSLEDATGDGRQYVVAVLERLKDHDLHFSCFIGLHDWLS